MRDKHHIFKHDGDWYLVRKPFGFSPHVSLSIHTSQKSAIFAAGGTTASSGLIERTYTPNMGTAWSGMRYDNFPLRIN